MGKTVVEIAENIGLKIKVIGSTDLTHYGMNYGFIPKGTGDSAYEWVRDGNDKRIIDAMIAMDGSDVIRQALANHNACCGGAAAAAISAAQEMGAEKGDLLAYASSYDKNPGDSFVGYAGILF
jgi:AmmeMemoRadiSam system protein B